MDLDLIISDNYEASARKAAEMIRDVIRDKPDAKLGLATGSTPVPIYQNLVAYYKAGELDFSKVHTVNLDEYAGLAPDHPQSYRFYMDHHLFSHVNIDPANTYVPNGLGPADANAKELDCKVFEGGAPDIQLLGIGGNGHIGFNEAGQRLSACSHFTGLTPSTIEANARFFTDGSPMPTQAITMGMKGILAAGKILLVATGPAKINPLRELLTGGSITTQNPSTFLKLHPDVTVIIDKELAKGIGLS